MWPAVRHASSGVCTLICARATARTWSARPEYSHPYGGFHCSVPCADLQMRKAGLDTMKPHVHQRSGGSKESGCGRAGTSYGPIAAIILLSPPSWPSNALLRRSWPREAPGHGRLRPRRVAPVMQSPARRRTTADRGAGPPRDQRSGVGGPYRTCVRLRFRRSGHARDGARSITVRESAPKAGPSRLPLLLQTFRC